MKIERKIRVSKNIAVLVVLSLFIGTIAMVYVLFKVYSAAKLSAPDQKYQVLGSVVEVTPAATDKKNGSIAATKKNNNSQNVLTIIFFYNGYESQAQILTLIEVMKEALNIVEPYKSMKDFIAFKVFTTDSKKCRVEMPAKILVCDKNLIDSFRKLGTNHFKVVLLSPEDFVSAAPLARGKNSWITLSTFQGTLNPDMQNRLLGVAFTNLLGHALGLNFEYTDSKDASAGAPSAPPPTGSAMQSAYYGKPNCAPTLDAAQKWWGAYIGVFPGIGYFQGCEGKKDYYYPEQHTLMSDKPEKESYGQVSTDYLRGVLACFYGAQNDIVYPAGKSATASAATKSCETFKRDYPNFWKE